MIRAATIEMKNLRKVFTDPLSKKETVALEDFSLRIEKGELATLLGPSGCGKTTVLRMLAGFEAPTSGKIFVGDRLINHLAPNQRNSAMVFQSYALFPHLTVRENIQYGLKFRKFSKEEKQGRFDRMIELVGLKGYENRRPNQLSGGQQQRVALARALVVEPEILLFDEPLSNLDAKLRESMRGEIRRIQKALSITAVYVTHDQSEAMAISDQVVVMNKARIEQVGSPQEVFHRPASRFVADFMGAANFIEAKALGFDGKMIRVGINRYEFPIRSEAAVKSGETLLLVARPDQFRIVAEGSGISTRVIDSVYLGSQYEYTVQGPDQRKWIIHLPASMAKIETGKELSIGFVSPEIHHLKNEISRETTPETMILETI